MAIVPALARSEAINVPTAAQGLLSIERVERSRGRCIWPLPLPVRQLLCATSSVLVHQSERRYRTHSEDYWTDSGHGATPALCRRILRLGRPLLRRADTDCR